MTLDFLIGYIKGFIKGSLGQNYLREILIACFTLLIGYVFDRLKLKREQKLRFQTGISSKVDSALQDIRDLVNRTHESEALEESIANLPELGICNYKELIYYPSFMENKETLSSFALSVSEARKRYEQYLDTKSAALLFILEKYLIDVAATVRKYEEEQVCQAVGTVVLYDIVKWRKEFDKHLVKRLNSPHYKLFTIQGKRWEKLKKYYSDKYIDKSHLKEITERMELISKE